MKFSHSYSEADPCSSGANSQRNPNVVPSFQPISCMSSQQLKSSHGTSGEIVESEYSGPTALAKENDAARKKYSNTYSRSDIQKLLNEPEQPALRLGIGPVQTKNSYASRKDQIELQANNLKLFDPYVDCPPANRGNPSFKTKFTMT